MQGKVFMIEIDGELASQVARSKVSPGNNRTPPPKRWRFQYNMTPTQYILFLLKISKKSVPALP
jgi:hypothetical protein